VFLVPSMISARERGIIPELEEEEEEDEEETSLGKS
jgi:hypothetical protein